MCLHRVAVKRSQVALFIADCECCEPQVLLLVMLLHESAPLELRPVYACLIGAARLPVHSEHGRDSGWSTQHKMSYTSKQQILAQAAAGA